MPLINITTSAKFHPYAGTSRQDPNREMIIKLAMALPRLMVNNLPDLRLDPTTMELAVQVTLQKFHPRSVHTPDVWIKVQFSEDGLTEKQRKKAGVDHAYPTGFTPPTALWHRGLDIHVRFLLIKVAEKYWVLNQSR